MRTSLPIVIPCIAALLLQGCSLSDQPLTASKMGKPSSSTEMERLIDQPGPIQFEAIDSAHWAVTLAGLLNLKSEAAVQAGLKDRDEPIEIYAHLLKHPRYGNFLVDTGVSRKVVADPGKEGINWVIQKVMHTDKIQIQKATDEIVQSADNKLDGIFLTHLHLDHILGLPDIADNVPLFIGQSESSETSFKNMFVHGATDHMLKGKQALQEWRFQPDPQGKFEGIIDAFGDGSLFVISVPGHSPGSVAFLIRSTRGPVLLTGDACITKWGWEHTVEPGDFTADHAHNLKNLQNMKQLAVAHPQIKVYLGHQHSD